MNLFLTYERYIRHQQTARVIVVNSVLFIFFAISSQVTKASSEVCSSTTLPNLMESLEKHASLQTASHMLEAHTAMQNTSETMEHLFLEGGFEGGGAC